MAGTKIAIVRGLNDNLGKPIGDMPFVNPLTKTQGEFMLELVKQRLAVYNDVLPQKSKLWRKGMSMIDNTLYNKNGAGVHGFTPYFGRVENELQFVARAAKDAAKLTNYATKQAYIGKKDIRKGYDFRLDTLNSLRGDLVDITEGLKNAGCIITHQRYNEKLGHYENYTVIDPNCRLENEFFIDLNTHLPKSAHQCLYNFVTDINTGNWTDTVKIKAVQHQQGMSEMARVAKISNALMTTWQKNCIIWHNAEKGIEGVMNPLDVINYISKDPTRDTVVLYDSRGAQIGVLDPITWAVIIKLGGVLIASIIATAGLIQVCKNKEPTAFASLAGIVTPLFASSGTDFKGTGGGGSIDKTCPTGFQYDETEKMCVRIDTGTGGGGGNTGGGTASNGFNLSTWVKENPLTAGLIGVGAGLALTAK